MLVARAGQSVEEMIAACEETARGPGRILRDEDVGQGIWEDAKTLHTLREPVDDPEIPGGVAVGVFVGEAFLAGGKRRDSLEGRQDRRVQLRAVRVAVPEGRPGKQQPPGVEIFTWQVEFL